MSGFKKFLLRGNVVDLAVAVVIGAAFGAVVTALVKDLLTPLIAAAFGKPDFSAMGFTVNGSRFLIGDFVNALIAFVLIAAAVYYVVILPLNAYMDRFGPKPPPVVPKKTCPECLSDVPAEAKRCAFCTSVLVSA